MKTIRIIVPIAILTLAAPLRAQTDDAAFLTQFEKTFEPGGAVQAKDFVTAELLNGRLHAVRPLADNDGLLNTYFVDTPDGLLEATGTPALKTRIREIYALDYLRGLSKTEEFGKAIGKTVEQKAESVVGIVRDPIGTVKNVPKGASRFFGRIGEGMKSVGKSEGNGSVLANIAGVNKAKAQLAAQLGVSPYTTNEELQRELTATARAMAGGGLVVSAATAAVSGGAGTALSVVGVNETLQNALVNSTPEDLRLNNRKKLLALGVNRALADEFLMHPWFSPWHETITTDALARIGVNPTAFLTDAVKALTPEDASFFQRVAQILARYHAEAAPLRAIRFEGGIITALDKSGTLVVPVSLDYAIWAERTARRAEEFAALAKGGGEIKGLAFWTDGQISERLAAELQQRHIATHARALDAAAR
ncbi:MAG: hypothetical protein K8R23_09035 [Chthoniobacter sp.]|nr:hypothetical protein [Chthoniobacter sp.]